MIEYFCFYAFMLTFLLYKYFSRNKNFWKERGVNGPTPLPLFGNVFDIFTTPLNILELRRSQKYGKIYGYFDMARPVISVSDVELLKAITIKDSHIFTNHLNITPEDPLLRAMVVNLEDDEWKRVRSLCTPAFTGLKIKQMFPLVDKCVDNTLSYLEKLAVACAEVNLKKTITAYATDVTAVCIFGIETNSYKDPDGEFVRCINKISDFANLRTLLGFIMPNIIRKAFGFQLFNPSSLAFLRKVLKQVINERRGKETDHRDFVKILLESEANVDNLNTSRAIDNNNRVKDVKPDKRYLDENEILAQCIIMVIGATETSTTTLSYLLWNLAFRTDVQEKLFNELRDYFEKGSHDYDSLCELPYLDAVLNETLRHYSPAASFDRFCKADYKLGETGITIPKGAVVNVPFYAIHHDPDYWPQPFEFNPERFVPENKHKITPYTFIPFGIGPRVCIGYKFSILVIKDIVAKLVYNFEIVKTQNTVLEPVYCGKKIMNQCKPLFVGVRRRNAYR